MAQISTDPKKKSSPLATIIRIVVSVGLLAFLLYKVGPANIFKAIVHADPLMVLAIFGIMFLEHLHGTYKWMILLNHTNSKTPFLALLRIRYLSAFIGNVGLGAVGIELVRMYGLARYTSDLAMSFTSILMDRLLGLTGLALMILLGLLMETRGILPGIEIVAGGALIFMLAMWFAIMNPKFRSLTDWILAKLEAYAASISGAGQNDTSDSNAGKTIPTKVWHLFSNTLLKIFSMIRDKQNKVYQSLDAYRGRPGLLAWGMLQSLLFNVLRISVYWAASRAIGLELPVSALFVVVPTVIFVMLIPISVSGWGVRETMFVSLLALYGAPKESVLAMSLLAGVCLVISSTPGAILLLLGSGAPKPNQADPVPNQQP